MNNYIKQAVIIVLLQLGIVSIASAVDYLELDFESAATGQTPASFTGYPIWFLPPSFDRNYGPGNHFEVVDTTAHSGNNSLRFTYDGRNGFCNTCGTKLVLHKEGLDGADYFVANDGQDLTLFNELLVDSNGKPILNSKGEQIFTSLPHASPGKMVYNQSQGYAQWEIVSIATENTKNDKLLLKSVRPGIGNFANAKPEINGRDQVSIARQCGVDGSIGIVNGQPSINRRSDCDSVISWLGGITPGIQPSGGSIFRRAYIKTDSVDPPQGQKLNYAFLGRSGATNTTVPITTIPTYAVIIPVGEYQSDTNRIEPWLVGLGPLGRESRYEPGKGLPDGFHFEHGEWYYIEQEFKAESYTTTGLVEGRDRNGNGTDQWTLNGYVGQGDGEYRLWISKSGEEPDKNNPTIEETGLALPPITGGQGTHMSLWGNHQHERHSRGVWYMDDIIISDQYIGPAPSPTKLGKATPKSPPVASE